MITLEEMQGYEFSQVMASESNTRKGINKSLSVFVKNGKVRYKIMSQKELVTTTRFLDFAVECYNEA